MADITESSSDVPENVAVVIPGGAIVAAPPLELVKEGVDHLNCSGPPVSQNLLELQPAENHDPENFDVEKMVEQAEQMERDLIRKEQETLNVLKQLETTRKFVEDLKASLRPESSSSLVSSDRPALSADLMLAELARAKSNLNKASIALAVIQASVESLNKKMRLDEIFLESKTEFLKVDCDTAATTDVVPDHSLTIFKQGKPADVDVEQLKKMKEASRYEVMRAMREIERTKNSIKMAEMRLNAARKMEEASKAVEATLAERKTLLIADSPSDDHHRMRPKKMGDNGIYCLTTAAHGESGPRQTAESKPMKFKIKTSRSGRRSSNGKESSHSTKDRPLTISIGAILSRKLILEGNTVVGGTGRRLENHRHSTVQQISLKEMLREQSRHIFHRTSSTAEAGIEKHVVVERKKFGFIQVLLPTRQSKKRAPSSNLR